MGIAHGEVGIVRIRMLTSDAAFAFAWYEQLLDQPPEVLEMKIKSFKEGVTLLERAGFEKLAYQDFAETAQELLDQLPRIDTQTLLSRFNDAETSNAIVVYLRFLTSAYMGEHADDYAPFLDQPLQDYRSHCVEAFGHEADDVMLTSLVAVLQTGLDVLYLDRSEGDEATRHEFRGG